LSQKKTEKQSLFKTEKGCPEVVLSRREKKGKKSHSKGGGKKNQESSRKNEGKKTKGAQSLFACDKNASLWWDKKKTEGTNNP